MKPLYVLAFLALSSPAFAQTSDDYSKMGMKTYSLWSCAVLTSYTKEAQEGNKLFGLGYETGKTFVEAVKAGKAKQEDLRKYAPMVFGDKLNNPNTDFALGRMFEAVLDGTVKEVWQDASSDEELRKNKAADMYRKQNCSFLK
ncbi:hypothetical protein AB4Y85_12895 [Microvirga sp. 2YAF29]|uniref:hypothetical protein n=1 Tax=Microvirga sp. 2YAF29 TaxID=3233031 RepID=UPI003F9C6D12